MKRIMTFRSLFLMGIVSLALTLGGINLIQAQVQTKAKPPGVGKPHKPSDCNNDGVCEKDEYNHEYAPGNQPCADCIPKNYAPLLVEQTLPQLVSENYWPTGKKIYQFKYSGGNYEDTWASDSIPDISLVSVDIGDVDNDTVKEIVAVASYFIREETVGRGKNRVTYQYYDSKIYLYESGSLGAPNWESPFLGETLFKTKDIIIGDADNDGDNELLLLQDVYRDQTKVDIYEWNGSGFQWTTSSPIFDYGCWLNFDLGDADNDGGNEIIVPLFGPGYSVVFKYDKIDGWSFVLTETIEIAYSPGDPIFIDYSRARDSDNDGKNEIVAGGNNKRLMIWKYNESSEAYDTVFVSEDLGGFTQGVDVGDIDGDGQKEILVGASQSETIYVYRYNNESSGYENVNSFFIGTGMGDLIVGDPNQDGKPEIILSCGDDGTKIFDFIGDDISSGYLQETYSYPYRSYSVKLK